MWRRCYTTNVRYNWRTIAPSQRPQKASLEYHRRQFPSPTLLTEDHPLFDKVSAYQQRFIPLLNAEQLESNAIVKERLATWPLKRLQQAGYCLTGLSAFWLQENRFGRPVASFMLGAGVLLPVHEIESGSQVLVSRIDPLKEEPYQGTVVDSNPHRLKVSFEEKVEIEQGEWRLDINASSYIYNRMKEAVRNMSQDPQLEENTSDELILQGTHVRDILLRTFSTKEDQTHEHVPLQDADDPNYVSKNTLDHDSSGGSLGAFQDDMCIQSWATRYSKHRPIVVEGDPILPNLNPSQVRAMATMVGQGASLIQGPPGTGKTNTIIETIKLLKLHFQVPQPILVCTFTNVAVDNLVEGFAAKGLKPLRVSFSGKARASITEHTLDHKVNGHELKKPLDKIEADLARLLVGVADLKKTLRDVQPETAKYNKLLSRVIAMERREKALSSKGYVMKQMMLKDIVDNADVICTTCITSACGALRVTDFPVVFVDEASMSTEPASLIPLMKGSRHFALIGDHKQLPPIIQSPEARQKGLGISLFERLTEEGIVPSVMLDTQYRMHPAISDFPSCEFYNDALHNGTIDAVGRVHYRLMPPCSQHLPEDANTGVRPSVIFLDHAGNESLKDRSRVNRGEADIVASVVEDLLLHNESLKGEDIGIIAPYIAQINLLKRMFTSDATMRARFKEVLGEHRAMQLDNIEIKTVDGFEGREKEIIIFSTVRNNAGGYIGFLADRRRLNVGLTRAKRGLFVVGSIRTLQAGKVSDKMAQATKIGKGADSWRRYAEYLDGKGLVVTLGGTKLQKALYGNRDAARQRHATG